MDLWESTPRIAFLSPEPASGKTRALEITETLVPSPVEAVNVSSAYMFRKVSDRAGLPTILFDEIDTIFGPRAKEHEDVRGLINAGHRLGAMAGRCVVRGNIVETIELPAYCAVALAGLGNLPDTILTRSIVIPMRRRASNEMVEPYRRRIHAPQGNAIRDDLAAWAKSISMSNGWPAMPDGITDRNADVWEPLLAVADAAGGGWTDKSRVAAVTHVTASMEHAPSLRVRLLADIRTVFASDSALQTRTLIDRLTALDEAPWDDLRGKSITPRRLGQMLKPYEVESRGVRISNDVRKGYTRESFYEAWRRYLPKTQDQSSPEKVTSVTSDTSTDGDFYFPEGPLLEL